MLPLVRLHRLRLADREGRFSEEEEEDSGKCTAAFGGVEVLIVACSALLSESLNRLQRFKILSELRISGASGLRAERTGTKIRTGSASPGRSAGPTGGPRKTF